MGPVCTAEAVMGSNQLQNEAAETPQPAKALIRILASSAGGVMKKYVVLIFLLSAGKASAFCSEGFGYDLASEINGKLQYLICLHNEQNKTINQHASLIDSQASTINDLEIKLKQQENTIYIQSSTISDLESKISELESDLQSLRNDHQSLESRVINLE